MAARGAGRDAADMPPVDQPPPSSTDPGRPDPAPSQPRPPVSAGERLLAGLERRGADHRRRGWVFRVAFVAAALVVVAGGALLVPLPGPGTLVLALGLAMLALEFAWARSVLERTVAVIDRAADRPRAATMLLVAGALGTAASIVVPLTLF